MKELKGLVINIFTLSFSLISCAHQADTIKTEEQSDYIIRMEKENKVEVATFGAGCFWCVEAQFQILEGVLKVESGFSGGHVKNASYKEVCTGTTGHAEVCNVYFNPEKISFDQLLAAFWQTHDPTQLNRQGNDIGTQYRSVIFYRNENQRQLSEEYKSRLNKEKVYDSSVVTEISPFTEFYKAEDYHANYYNQNSEESYCQFVIRPKLEKFQKVFKDKLKSKP